MNTTIESLQNIEAQQNSIIAKGVKIGRAAKNFFAQKHNEAMWALRNSIANEIAPQLAQREAAIESL